MYCGNCKKLMNTIDILVYVKRTYPSGDCKEFLVFGIEYFCNTCNNKILDAVPGMKPTLILKATPEEREKVFKICDYVIEENYTLEGGNNNVYMCRL